MLENLKLYILVNVHGVTLSDNADGVRNGGIGSTGA